ncbi:DUF5320 domain-containing protein [Thermosediminibacter litoriperuensis]|uniref:DUF5320 domain-containing protein n=1 Tax=Thermosediminibacter litoriperuensis TaxID=291989 RepID=A0A5S5AWM3_9FIRM|nr:DUF5320 domain-containing protein [Thermosediminibacter litoriperuensis]TYP57593.1 hypothetical protein LZ11_00586 [Thermosediminibacter litoriperuensis]
MPRVDGTGPLGFGLMTGRAAGFCAGFPVPGFMNPVGRRFWRRTFGPGLGAFGFGHGWRWRYYATGLPFWAVGSYHYDPATLYPDDAEPATENERKYEAKILAQEARLLKEQLKVIEERLEQLRKSKKEGLDEEKGRE